MSKTPNLLVRQGGGGSARGEWAVDTGQDALANAGDISARLEVVFPERGRATLEVPFQERWTSGSIYRAVDSAVIRRWGFVPALGNWQLWGGRGRNPVPYDDHVPGSHDLRDRDSVEAIERPPWARLLEWSGDSKRPASPDEDEEDRQPCRSEITPTVPFVQPEEWGTRSPPSKKTREGSPLAVAGDETEGETLPRPLLSC